MSPAPAGKKGWGIFYNSGITSPGRINFTLGHEFGHYMLHRQAYPEGFQCSTEDMATSGIQYGQRENEANVFAATLLMPLDDFRAQIADKHRPNFEELSECANRYDVSLIAATLRWLQYTARRSMLVVSRDGFILWARSSGRALRSGLYFRTQNTPPIEMPAKSLAANTDSLAGSTGTRRLDGDTWLREPCTEHVVLSEQYDFTLSLLHFSNAQSRSETLEDEVEDTVDRMRRRTPGQSWLS
ncbi:MAG: ImmA/IrrE family metallo-endopeptidase [Gammaproteobacteria bacterium]|nr:ImmA/IrrE family metallo-endopeptidase [Gammaproteobacteria bacterium]